MGNLFRDNIYNEFPDPNKKIEEIGEQVDDATSKLDVLQKNSVSVLSYENLKVAIANGYDWAPCINAAKDSVSKGVVFLPPRDDYRIASEITVDKYIRIVGVGSLITKVTLDNPSAGFTFKGTAASYLSLSGIGLEGLTIEGGDIAATAVKAVYIARGIFKDIVINRVKGNGIYLRSMQDSVFENVYLRYCGDRASSTAALFIDQRNTSETADTNNNVNDNKFISVTFEHDNGKLLISKGDSNNCNIFIGCKFEYNNTANTTYDEPIDLDGVDRYEFDNCRFTHFKKKAFKINNSQNIKVSGLAYNSTDPEGFADITNSYNLEFNVAGRKVGKLVISGNSYYIQDNLQDKDIRYNVFYLLDKYNPSESIDLRNIHYNLEGSVIVDDVTAPFGYAIKGSSSDNQKVIRNLITKHDVLRDGVTFYFNAKSTSSKTYEVRVRNASNTDTIVSTITVGTAYQVYSVSIPHYLLTRGSSLIITNTTSQSGINLYLGDMWYELKHYSATIPTTGSWGVGDIVYNSSPAAAGKLGWVCVTSGTPGTWKAFGAIDA